MDNSVRILTSTKDLGHNLCEAVSHAIKQDTDMVIVTRDNQLLPCHSSILALFSPVVARLLSEIPCCAAPTIFLPDFHALHIRKLLQILRSGQAIPGETVNSDIKKIIAMAKVLQISIADLSVGPYRDNPLGVTLEVKQESKILNVKRERHSVDVVKVLKVKEEADSFNVKQEEKLGKQELMEQSEYIEEDVPEKTQKQEYAVSVDDDKLLDDISDFQSVVEEEVQESNSLDKEDYNTVSIDNIQLNEDEETGSLKHKANSNKRTSLRLLRQKEFIGTPRNLNNKRRKVPCRQLQSSLDSTDDSTTIIPFNQYIWPPHSLISSQDPEVIEDRAPAPAVSHQRSITSSELKRNKRSHTDEKIFQCLVCLNMFSTSSSLNLHKRVHTGEKPYQCLLCPKTFSTSGNLNQHKTVHTGEKPYQCPHCSKTFSQLSSLNRHNRIHTGEQPYTCPLCPKTFSFRKQLNRHEKVHSGGSNMNIDESVHAVPKGDLKRHRNKKNKWYI